MLTLSQTHSAELNSLIGLGGDAEGSPQKTVIDYNHLSRCTMGDAELEAEVLNLFAGQLPMLLAQLRQARAVSDARAWHHAAHSLKGSARAVGAIHLAILSEVAEQDCKNFDLASLSRAIEDVIHHIGVRQR